MPAWLRRLISLCLIAIVPFMLSGCLFTQLKIRSLLCFGPEGCEIVVFAEGFSSSQLVNRIADEDGCLLFNDLPECPAFRICGFIPGELYLANVACSDPVLMEWPDDWNLLGAGWATTSGSASGQILVEPASAYIVQPQFGAIVTDPGYSAHVLRLDTPNLAPTEVKMTFFFEQGILEAACVKGVLITTVEVPRDSTEFIVPAEAVGLDFTQLLESDPHVRCLDLSMPIQVQESSWGSLKAIYR